MKEDDDEFAYRSYRRQWNEQFLCSSSSSSQPRQDHKRLRQQSLATDPTMVVFGVCWYQASTEYNSDTDKDDDKIVWLLACTNQGQVCVFSVPSRNPYLVDDNDDAEEEGMDYWNSTNHNTIRRPQQAWNPMPLAQWKVSHGVLYSIQITTFGKNSNNKEWLVVSGDEGVLVWDWTPQVPALRQRQYQRQQQQASMTGSSCSTPTPPVAPLPPLQRVTHLQPPPWSLGERSEVNDVACSDPFVYGATGHAAGTKWNVETQQLVATYSSQMTMTSTTPSKRGRGGGSWHALSLVPACDTTMTENDTTSTTTPASSNHKWLLAGGEEGLLQVWDVQHDALVDQLDVVTAAVSSLSGRTMSPIKRTTTTPTTHGWISSIVPVFSGHDDDDHSCSWWTVAGGWHPPPSRGTGTLSSLGGGSDPRGFVTTWHAPTRTLVTSTGTPSPIHQLATTGGEGLWAVGTGRRLSHQEDCSTQTPVVSVWNNPWSLQTDDTGRNATMSHTAPPLSPGCGYAVATTRVVHPRSIRSSSSSRRTHRWEDKDNHSDNDDNHNNQDDEQWWVATGGVGTTVFVLDGTTRHVVFQCSIPLSSSSSQGWDPIAPS